MELFNYDSLDSQRENLLGLKNLSPGSPFPTALIKYS